MNNILLLQERYNNIMNRELSKIFLKEMTSSICDRMINYVASSYLDKCTHCNIELKEHPSSTENYGNDYWNDVDIYNQLLLTQFRQHINCYPWIIHLAYMDYIYSKIYSEIYYKEYNDYIRPWEIKYPDTQSSGLSKKVYIFINTKYINNPSLVLNLIDTALFDLTWDFQYLDECLGRLIWDFFSNRKKV